MYKNKYIQYKYKCKNMIGGMIDKEIYFIRHAETDYNKEGRTQGQENDMLLNKTGMEQAEKTGEYLKKFRFSTIKPDVIISSPMERAKQTAIIIAGIIELDNIEYYNELKETKRGVLSGLTDNEEPRKTYKKLMDDAVEKLIDPIEKYELEDYLKSDIFFEPVIGDIGIEKYEEVSERVKFVINYLKTTKHKKIIVVSHSGFFDVLLKEMFNTNVVPKGNMSNGKNCWISYCIYTDGILKMISPRNTEHLEIV